jgi:hypothetical protein
VRLVTFNVATIDGRVGVSTATPSWLDPRWKPRGRFETVDVLALHGTRVFLEGSNSFTARDAPEAAFEDYADAPIPAGTSAHLRGNPPGRLRLHPLRGTLSRPAHGRQRRL